MRVAASGPGGVRAWASVARDLMALLFTPVVTGVLAWLVCILAYGRWGPGSEGLRLHYLGAALILLCVLVGLGGQWMQRNRLERLSLRGPGGFGGEIETEAEADGADGADGAGAPGRTPAA